MRFLLLRVLTELVRVLQENITSGTASPLGSGAAFATVRSTVLRCSVVEEAEKRKDRQPPSMPLSGSFAVLFIFFMAKVGTIPLALLEALVGLRFFFFWISFRHEKSTRKRPREREREARERDR